ncbi:hypothetical protein J6590_047926 [Homalodisca vitripennis]|nr:hypothetical protein J6590_047926 [Homalodisca vitripennis]
MCSKPHWGIQSKEHLCRQAERRKRNRNSFGTYSTVGPGGPGDYRDKESCEISRLDAYYKARLGRDPWRGKRGSSCYHRFQSTDEKYRWACGESVAAAQVCHVLYAAVRERVMRRLSSSALQAKGSSSIDIKSTLDHDFLLNYLQPGHLRGVWGHPNRSARLQKKLVYEGDGVVTHTEA